MYEAGNSQDAEKRAGGAGNGRSLSIGERAGSTGTRQNASRLNAPHVNRWTIIFVAQHDLRRA